MTTGLRAASALLVLSALAAAVWPAPAGATVVKIRTWGSLGSGAGQLHDPIAAAVGPAGHVYVTDSLNNRIDEFTASGGFIRAWGFGVRDGSPAFQKCTSTCRAGIAGAGDGQFDAPYGIGVDASGEVYVSDANNDRLEKFSRTGTFLAKWGQTGSAGGQFKDPRGVSVSPAGFVRVVDAGNNRVEIFRLGGGFRLAWGWGVASGTPRPEQCRTLCEAGLAGAGDGQFDAPSSVATNTTGSVYVTDNGNQRVERFARDRFLTSWGRRLLRNPKGIAVDTAGRVEVCDTTHNRILQFSPKGVFLDRWGGRQLRDPEGVAAAPGDRLIVVDTGHNRIVKYAQIG